LGPGRGGVGTLASIILGAPPLRARVTQVTQSPSNSAGYPGNRSADRHLGPGRGGVGAMAPRAGRRSV